MAPTPDPAGSGRVGVVAIGRNEGERLERCLRSVPVGVPSVYVDSGSTDQSVAFAQGRGVEVVCLDPALPFSAARARNAGWRRLLELHPQLDRIQFVDGDCEIHPDWLDVASRALDADESLVAVCGRRRERFPERTVFNGLCEVEWRSPPVGDVRAFGGDVLIRVEPLRKLDGYADDVIAAEDDELSARLRRAGGRLRRIEAPMTLHDVDMHRLSAWWRRAVRAGHGFAQVSSLHGAPPERVFVRETRRAWFWGLALPAFALGAAPWTAGLSLWALLAYPLQIVRTAAGARRLGLGWARCLAWGASCVLGQPAAVLGMLRFHRGRLSRRPGTLIEYKGGEARG